MAMVDARVLTSANDCLDIEVFSSIDNYIIYSGYPDQDLVDNTTVVDELGRAYQCYIDNDRLHCAAIEDNLLVLRTIGRIRAYIATQSSDTVDLKYKDLRSLIDDIVVLRGITY